MRIHNDSWNTALSEEISKPYIKDIEDFLIREKEAWKIIYPREKDIFQAFNYCSLQDVQVVILWQDPYHWEGQAHWLSFSVKAWVKTPPSLRNIYKEIESDFWVQIDFTDGNLCKWAQQWVLLLNSILTVEAKSPWSHSRIWWEKFTDTVIKKISAKKQWVVFMLWWAFAISKIDLIDSQKHLILQSPHPSPFSAYKWFFWNNHFKICNDYLVDNNNTPINWCI